MTWNQFAAPPSRCRWLARRHYCATLTHKERAARNVANSVLCLESHIGTIPSTTTQLLYHAHVEPNLTYGCEAVLNQGRIAEGARGPTKSVSPPHARG